MIRSTEVLAAAKLPPRRYSISLLPASLDVVEVVDLPDTIAEEQPETLDVTCPEGVSAGDIIYVQYGEEEVEVTVPDGVAAGDEFEVNINGEEDEEEEEEEEENDDEASDAADQQSSLHERIADALGPDCNSPATISALLTDADAAKLSHPSVGILQQKLARMQQPGGAVSGKDQSAQEEKWRRRSMQAHRQLMLKLRAVCPPPPDYTRSLTPT